MDAGGFIKVADVIATDTLTADKGMSEDYYLKSLSPEDHAQYEKLITAAEANNLETDITEPKKDPLKDAFGGIASKWGIAASVLSGLVAMLFYLTIIFSFAA